MSENFAPKIIHNLKVLQSFHKSKNEVWKAKAYTQALARIKEPIYSKEDIEKYNFGKGIKEKVLTIIATNNDLQTVIEINQSNHTVDSEEVLSKIHAIGRVKAKELVEKHNITTIEELKNNTHLLNAKQVIGLKYHDDISKYIPRTEMIQHDKKITDIFKEHFKLYKTYSIVGSYRREKIQSGDIDLIVLINNPSESKKFIQSLVNVFQTEKYIPDDGILAKGEKKLMGICSLNANHPFRRIDVLVTNSEEYIFSILYFTGSGEFNVKMREHAKKIGYTLNEKGLFKGKERVSVEFNSELDIFEFLKIEYVEPKYRESDNFRVMSNLDNTEM